MVGSYSSRRSNDSRSSLTDVHCTVVLNLILVPVQLYCLWPCHYSCTGTAVVTIHATALVDILNLRRVRLNQDRRTQT
eukprot:SAG11_NODE_21262_length_421_cov_2.610942_1_plen_77_part_01